MNTETNTAATGVGEVRKARALIDHCIHGEVASDALTEAHDLLTTALAAQPAPGVGGDAVKRAGLLLPILRNSAESWGNHHCAGELRRAIELIEALISTRPAESVDAWKEAILNELIVAHIYTKAHETDPRKAIQDAITWNCQVALDPKVSSDAQALIDQGRAAESVAQGREWMLRLAKEIKANAEDHPGDYIAKFALAWADELAARAISSTPTPATGSGGEA